MAMAVRLTLVGLLTALSGVQVGAYNQGSFFLFDIRDDAIESGAANRIVVASSVFKSPAAESDAVRVAEQPKSEFETRVTSLKSETDESGVEILSTVSGAGTSESSFGDSGFGESSFDEDPPASSGFYFSF